VRLYKEGVVRFMFLDLSYRLRRTPSSGGIDACGDSAGGVVGLKPTASHESLKQEESNNAGQKFVLSSVV